MENMSAGKFFSWLGIGAVLLLFIVAFSIAVTTSLRKSNFNIASSTGVTIAPRPQVFSISTSSVQITGKVQQIGEDPNETQHTYARIHDASGDEMVYLSQETLPSKFAVGDTISVRGFAENRWIRCGLEDSDMQKIRDAYKGRPTSSVDSAIAQLQQQVKQFCASFGIQNQYRIVQVQGADDIAVVTSFTPSSPPQDNGGAPLVRKTLTGIVRTSVIGFNKEMNINQQTIIFGGDKNALDDGSGSYCIVNGDQNFANTVAGDTITVTGEAVPASNALINCRVDSLQ